MIKLPIHKQKQQEQTKEYCVSLSCFNNVRSNVKTLLSIFLHPSRTDFTNLFENFTRLY